MEKKPVYLTDMIVEEILKQKTRGKNIGKFRRYLLRKIIRFQFKLKRP